MLDYDPAANLTHYPLPMARFGLTPYGDPLYRVIFAPSRRNLAGDESGFRWVPTYRRLGAVWVLERWRSAWDFAKCSRETWDRQWLILGPYPERGEYDHVHTFDPVGVADCNLDKLVSWIEEGKTRSFQEHLDACREDYAQEEKDKANMREAIVRNAYPAFAANAFVSAGAKRGTKTVPITKTAEELGLPTGHNKFVNLRRQAAG